MLARMITQCSLHGGRKNADVLAVCNRGAARRGWLCSLVRWTQCRLESAPRTELPNAGRRPLRAQTCLQRLRAVASLCRISDRARDARSDTTHARCDPRPHRCRPLLVDESPKGGL